MRTIRVLRPGAFAFLFLSFTLPLALLGAALIPAEPAALASWLWALVAAAITARLFVHAGHRAARRSVSCSRICGCCPCAICCSLGLVPELFHVPRHLAGE